MAIDYSIDYPCPPKQQLGAAGILARLKGVERAKAVIRLFREHGDNRSPSQMGFEFTRRTPQGDEESVVIVVQDLLDEAAELQPLESHCSDCPANCAQRSFGCMGFIQYPIAAAAEQWLLAQLPKPEEALCWLLLRRGVADFQYDGSSAVPLRDGSGIYFEADTAVSRQLGELSIDANQLFEMVFLVGNLNPNHGAMLLLFQHAIDRDLEANAIMQLVPASADARQKHPFRLPIEDGNPTIAELKAFLYALYVAWTLNVSLTLDV